MKPQKILLLVLVLLLSLALAACNSDKAPEAPDCFVFDEHPSSDDITELEGKIIAVNKKYDLVALETVSVDASGMSQRIVKVIDLANENRVLYKDITSTSPTEATPPIEYSLASYPFIKATRWVRMANDKDGNPCYEERYDYHLISKTEHAALIESGLTEDDLSVTAVNNIFIAKHDGVLSWINSDLEIMRNVSADVISAI